jgi:hypothetical protein
MSFQRKWQCDVAFDSNDWEVYEDFGSQSSNKLVEYKPDLKCLGLYDPTNPDQIIPVEGSENNGNLRIFRKGASLRWEDYYNAGQMSTRLKKEETTEKWTQIVHSIVNKKCPYVEKHVIGIVLSLRNGSNAIHVWCINNNQHQKNREIMQYLIREFKLHVVYLPFQILKKRHQARSAAQEKRKLSISSSGTDSTRNSVCSTIGMGSGDSESELSGIPTPQTPLSEGSETPPHPSEAQKAAMALLSGKTETQSAPQACLQDVKPKTHIREMTTFGLFIAPLLCFAVFRLVY